MNAALTEIRRKQLARIRREILTTGKPLTWAAARLVMNSGSYDMRDARWHNETLVEFLNAGELKRVELDNGDSLISL